MKARDLFPNLEDSQDITAAIAAIDSMPVELPAAEDPDAFCEGEPFLVQQDEEVEEWEEMFDFQRYLGE